MSPRGRSGGGACLYFLTPSRDIHRLEKKGLALELTLLGPNFAAKENLVRIDSKQGIMSPCTLPSCRRAIWFIRTFFPTINYFPIRLREFFFFFSTKIFQVIFISRGTYSELFPFCFSPQSDLLYWLHFFHSQLCYTEILCPMSQSQIIYLGYFGVKILSNKTQSFCHVFPPPTVLVPLWAYVFMRLLDHQSSFDWPIH